MTRVTDKDDVAVFIMAQKEASFSAIEKYFISVQTESPKKTVCPECGDTDFNVFPNGMTTCKRCGFTVREGYRIARQTLVNYLKDLINEGVVTKEISKKTLKPVYVLTEEGQKKIYDIALRKKLQSLINTTRNLAKLQDRILEAFEQRERTNSS